MSSTVMHCLHSWILEVSDVLLKTAAHPLSYYKSELYTHTPHKPICPLRERPVITATLVENQVSI